jgi:enoyl-CoA hydratase
MTSHAVVYEPGAVARVIINRPERKNAQSALVLSELEQAFDQAIRDPDVRVIVLSGAGEHFSSGHDLGSPEHLETMEAQSRGLDPFGRRLQRNDLYIESHLRLRNLLKPTVAMVQGYCVYGGWAIASAMDCIFAADDALLMPIYGGFATTPWDVGARKAKEILFENRFMTAAEALQWGFINRVHPAAELEQRTLAYAARVAEKDSAFLGDIKFGINQTLDMMGFTTSVRTLTPTLLRQPEQPSQESTSLNASRSIVRDRVQRALDYLREDEPSLAPPAKR